MFYLNFKKLKNLFSNIPFPLHFEFSLTFDFRLGKCLLNGECLNTARFFKLKFLNIVFIFSLFKLFNSVSYIRMLACFVQCKIHKIFLFMKGTYKCFLTYSILSFFLLLLII